MANTTARTFIDPDQAAIQRRQRLADVLAEQSAAPSPNFSFQGYQAPIPATEGLAKVLAGFGSGLMEKRAERDSVALKDKYRTQAQEFLAAIRGGDKEALAGGLMSDNPYISSAAPALYTERSRQDAADRAAGSALKLKAAPGEPTPGRDVPYSPEVFAQLEALKKDATAGNGPMSIQEWNTFQQMTPAQKEEYLLMKRANPYVNLGDSMARPKITEPGVNAVLTKGVSPDAQPELKGRQAEAAAIGTGAGNQVVEAGKKERDSSRMLSDLSKVDGLIDKSTGSTAGALADSAAALVGKSTEGAKAIAELKVIQAGLMTSMPRMEGPQSDRDVQLYKEAAGQIADPTIPRETRKAAVRTIRQLQGKYTQAGAVPGAPEIPATATAGQGSLTPAEQKELDALRARFGR